MNDITLRVYAKNINDMHKNPPRFPGFCSRGSEKDKYQFHNYAATNIMCVTVLDYTNAEEICINTIDDEKLEELYRKYGISED